jgi:hypothetical protein
MVDDWDGQLEDPCRVSCWVLMMDHSVFVVCEDEVGFDRLRCEFVVAVAVLVIVVVLGGVLV